ncbi:MAG: hypothetical protein HKP61_05950 [Dactylosporangium sp.]|nr:hypothetical protein [Dactylosporangium sp.]
MATGLSRRRDRGAATAVVSVVVGSGVLIGAGAVVVDVGRLYVERGELQRGADAAAIAVANECAKDPDQCANQLAVAQRYVDDNAADGNTRITAICGNGQGLPACPAEPTNLSGCLTDPPTGGYVEVHAATESVDGQTVLPPVLATGLAGNSTDNGHAVGACARAAWGTPTSAATVAVTISTCVWNHLTSNGTSLAAPPPAVPSASFEGAIYLHDSRGSTPCPAGPSGWNAPGGFGWLDELAGPCASEVDANGEYGSNPGVSASQSCKTVLAAARASRTVLTMSIFDGVRGNGANAAYHLDGFTSFVLTGYALPGFSATSNLTGDRLCRGQEKCLYGYFTTGIVSATELSPTASNYGAMTTMLVG